MNALSPTLTRGAPVQGLFLVSSSIFLPLSCPSTAPIHPPVVLLSLSHCLQVAGECRQTQVCKKTRGNLENRRKPSLGDTPCPPASSQAWMSYRQSTHPQLLLMSYFWLRGGRDMVLPGRGHYRKWALCTAGWDPMTKKRRHWGSSVLFPNTECTGGHAVRIGKDLLNNERRGTSARIVRDPAHGVQWGQVSWVGWRVKICKWNLAVGGF